jgi:hypothetical protein
MRWRKWLPDRRLTCAAGHHIPSLVALDESGSIRCNKWIDGAKIECGRWIWVMAFRGGGNLVVEVSLEDLKRLKNLSTPAERIAYLEIFDDEAA